MWDINKTKTTSNLKGDQIMFKNRQTKDNLGRILIAQKEDILSLIIVTASLLAGISHAKGDTITVGPATGWDFQTVQEAIDAAQDGDTVLVAPGEYIITEPVTFRGKAITVKSEAGPDETTIRMSTPADINRASVVIFENTETDASVLEGFTITGGKGSRRSDPYGNRWSGPTGGAILCWEASPTIIACTIINNEGSHGSGITCLNSHAILRDCLIAENETPVNAGGVASVSGSSLILTNCTIKDNSAHGFGGGLLCWDNASASLANCNIRGNSVTGVSVHSAGYGGGLSCLDDSSLILTDCYIGENSAGMGGAGIQCYKSLVTITNCVITENSGGVIGGAMFCEQNSSATMSDCIIRGNSIGTWGGGIECYLNSSLTMTNCEVISNTSQRQGGGVECSDHSSVTLTNCLIARNSAAVWGGGLSCDKAVAFMTVNNCTIWGNSAGQTGGAMGCDKGASAIVTNSILWGNTAPEGSEIWVRNRGTFSVTNSNAAGGEAAALIDGGTINWGVGNIEADPLFADPNNGDFHLRSQAGRWNPNSQSWVQDDVTSPCIDAGDPMSPIGLEPFPSGGFVNMGAYGSMPEASKAYFGEPVCGTIIAGDINGDCQVNRADLEIMAMHWTDDEPLFP
jgi:hypothetical protein